MRKKNLLNICLAATFAGMLGACNGGNGEIKSYNEGIHIIPLPQTVVEDGGRFKLSGRAAFGAGTPEAKAIAEFFAAKIKNATGYELPVKETGDITLKLDPNAALNEEGYELEVTTEAVDILAKTPQGLFYGMQSFMQLLPAEIESTERVKGIEWSAPAVSIKDEPRFAYRGLMIDACRHFMSVDDVKKQLDVMALFKMNRMHWHLTDDQGWRIEIKKYPKLTEIGSKRIDGEGTEYGGFYTQEEVKDIVKYAAERFITIVPEIELPGHELAAISAYPELSCTGQPTTPRIIWGVEDIVMCAGKEEPFKFMEDVINEIAPLFPGEYFHIGGDECPKTSWKHCPLCQQRIRKEGLQGNSKHTAEERLQSYFVQRMEKVVEKNGKKMIGWDEILEGGLAPSATVMSWRGEEGGIAAALMNHDVIMTPGSKGMYLDQYEGDYKIEPVTIGGYDPLSKVYDYNPVPDTLVTLKKDKHVIGVQGNVWSEYLYTNEIREYRTFPRALAVAEIGWTQPDKKNYDDFERRMHNAYVRLDKHNINYNIPQPEQWYGSCNTVAFTDTVSIPFKNPRGEKMVYTLDGTEPSAGSTPYDKPLFFDKSATLKIATLLPSGKLGKTRTIRVEKQSLAPAAAIGSTKPGLQMEVTDGMYLNVKQLGESGKKPMASKVIKETRELTSYVQSSESMRGVKQYAAVATGYVDIPADGVYYISSELEEVWMDGKLLVDNGGEVKRFSRKDTSVALAKGKHALKAVFLGHIIGGWPSNWNDGSIRLRKSDETVFKAIQADALSH